MYGVCVPSLTLLVTSEAFSSDVSKEIQNSVRRLVPTGTASVVSPAFLKTISLGVTSRRSNSPVGAASFFAPLAIVYGNKAKGEIGRSSGNLTGGGLATAGIIMGWIGIALTVLLVVGILIGLANS